MDNKISFSLITIRNKKGEEASLLKKMIKQLISRFKRNRVKNSRHGMKYHQLIKKNFCIKKQRVKIMKLNRVKTRLLKSWNTLPVLARVVKKIVRMLMLHQPHNGGNTPLPKHNKKLKVELNPTIPMLQTIALQVSPAKIV